MFNSERTTVGLSWYLSWGANYVKYRQVGGTSQLGELAGSMRASVWWFLIQEIWLFDTTTITLRVNAVAYNHRAVVDPL